MPKEEVTVTDDPVVFPNKETAPEKVVFVAKAWPVPLKIIFPLLNDTPLLKFVTPEK